MILRRLGIDENRAVIYVSRNNLEEVAKQVASATEPMTIRVTAAANIIYGEALWLNSCVSVSENIR